MLDQDNNFFISLSIFITCWLDTDIWGEVTSKSLLRVTGLSHRLISHTCERQLNSIWKAYEKYYPFLTVFSHGFELVKIFNNWSWLFCSNQ